MKHFKNILYVSEPTADQQSTIARAVSLAVNNQADLTVLDVIQNEVVTAGIDLMPEIPKSFDLQTEVESDHRQAMAAMVQSFKGHMEIRLEVLYGKTYLEAIRAVLKNGYDLLIKPTENPTWTNRLFGSDDLHLLRKCPCPVWLMKTPEKTNYRNIMAAVDFNPLASPSSVHDPNREILELAASLSLSDFATLHIVHAWEAIADGLIASRAGMSAEGVNNYVETERTRHGTELSRLAEKLSGWIGKDAYDHVSPRLHLPEGPPKKVIAPFAAELRADLVVMGTVARTGISGLIIGNTAEAILDQLSCSVLAVKPPGFKTPVKIES